MGCKYIYNDASGNPSAIYLRALEKFGPEKAEEMYIRHMMSTIDTRFSRDIISHLDEQKNKIEATNPEDPTVESVYIEKSSGSALDRVTSLVASYIKKTKAAAASFESMLFPATDTAPVDTFELGKQRQADMLIGQTFSAAVQNDQELLKKAIEEAKAQDPDLNEKARRDIETLWNAQAYWGTEFHYVVSKMLETWEEKYSAQERGADGKLPKLNIIANIYDVVREAKEALIAEGKWYMPGTFTERFSEETLRKSIIDLLKAVEEQEKSLPFGANRYVFKPEMPVFTKKLKEPGNGKSGIGGSIDLLLVAEDGSSAITMDFKTKMESKVGNFDKPVGGTISGPFSDLSVTPENKAEAQQLLYAAILREEYGLDVTKTISVVVPMMFYDTAKAGIGNADYRASLIGSFKINPARYTESKVGQVIDYFRVGNLKTFYSDAREKGIAGITERWSGYQDDGQPNATFLKEHKEPYIKNKLGQVYVDRTTGKKTINTWGKRIDVSKLNHEELVARISAEYDAGMQVQQNLGSAVIRYFEHPDEPLPNELKGRQTSISRLLRGINNTTHRLELAQGFMPELAGIGPDVLIATNRLTKAVSILSAVVTTNTDVKFTSEGSKEPRSSLLGNYITDKELESNVLHETLMTSPKSHDFISMKLGLAALYANKKAGGKVGIDVMRVATISPGVVYTVTESNLEQELAKLALFKKYAGDDFPAEYGVLLDEFNKTSYIAPTAKHLESLMIQIGSQQDPLGFVYKSTLSKELLAKYNEYQAGSLVGYELKELLGKYLEAVSSKLKINMTDSQVLNDPRFLVASKAMLEFLKFENNLGKLASERMSTTFISSAVTSGDKIMLKLHVLYTEASSKIRKDMDSFSKEHTRLLNALQKETNTDWVGSTDLAFKNLYKNSDFPEDRMMLKEVGSPEFNKLSKAEQEYIVFFNDHINDAMVRVSPERLKEEVRTGRFWKEGTVPVLEVIPSLINKETMTSWTAARKAWSRYYNSLGKKTSGTRSILEYDFGTRFESQATDESPGNSEHRRRVLGLKDINAPVKAEPVEKNLAFILNLATLQASEKDNYKILLQTVNAAKAMLVAEGDTKTKMTEDMMNTWREMIIFGRYTEEPMKKFTTAIDATNKASSTMLFAYSLKQAMIEFSTGTLQNGASLIANSVQNAVADFLVKDGSKGGRFTAKEWAWATRIWNKYDQKIEQMVYDGGVLQADAADLQTEEFRGLNRARTFASKSGYWMNRLFFNSAITHTYIAQLKHLGIVDAYVKIGDVWSYDETLDKRFFVYDPENNLGERAPVTDEEKQKHSLWKATRKVLSDEGMLDNKTKRMILPMTANERAEIKHYGTRLYGSFNSDSKVAGEALAVGRAMFRYKKWMTQRISNYWTPTIRDEAMYGHWQTDQDPDTGEYFSHWVGDDFQGIIQTLGHLMTELNRTKSLAFMGELNKYQRENLSKLLADLIMILLMAFMILPWMSDTEIEIDPVTGEETKVTGEFGKSTLGDSALKGATNALADMFFINSVSGMTSSLFPGLGVAASAGQTALKILASTVKGDVSDLEDLTVSTAKRYGITRTGLTIAESAGVKL